MNNLISVKDLSVKFKEEVEAGVKVLNSHLYNSGNNENYTVDELPKGVQAFLLADSLQKVLLVSDYLQTVGIKTSVMVTSLDEGKSPIHETMGVVTLVNYLTNIANEFNYTSVELPSEENGYQLLLSGVDGSTLYSFKLSYYDEPNDEYYHLDVYTPDILAKERNNYITNAIQDEEVLGQRNYTALITKESYNINNLRDILAYKVEELANQFAVEGKQSGKGYISSIDGEKLSDNLPVIDAITTFYEKLFTKVPDVDYVLVAKSRVVGDMSRKYYGYSLIQVTSTGVKTHLVLDKTFKPNYGHNRGLFNTTKLV